MGEKRYLQICKIVVSLEASWSGRYTSCVCVALCATRSCCEDEVCQSLR